MKGKPAWNKGIACKEETKKKLSKAITGRHRVFDEKTQKYKYI